MNLEYADGQTPIDEDEKWGLKIKSISTMGELNEFEQQNIEEFPGEGKPSGEGKIEFCTLKHPSGR
ncbi:MAG: hypothetical protein IPN33_21055 [Saprospiraceae bacterium]|nr:hypothetical protein [Saprospiraceae bacterium]